MSVISLEVKHREPFAGGASFGEAGQYERLDGTLHFAVDPLRSINRSIVDLDRAERDTEGRVRFSADFCLLQPLDPSRGSGRLLLDVLNRGRKVAVRMFNQAPFDLEPSETIDPGDGFLMRHGWSVGWVGWQWDVIRSPALLGLEPPQALESGRPVAGTVLVQFQTNARVSDHLLADRVHQPYPAAHTEDPDAVLRVRDYPDAPAETVERSQWRFARDEGGSLIPDDQYVWLAGGFEAGRFYEVIYRTARCPIAGAGLIAIRDAASFLRYAQGQNPCAGSLHRAYAFGMSQSGRFLRHLLYLGMNVDEEERPVFDGVFSLVAGARRGEFNHRFAQPSVQYNPSFGHLPPFADEYPAPVGGLLDRQREIGGVPKLLSMNTAAEYWRGDCSLLHVDLKGERDIEPPSGSVVYHLASTQHLPGVLPLVDTWPTDGSRGAQPFNAVDYRPLLRSALVNLDRWVTSGVEPPPNFFPRIGRTATSRDAVIERFRALKLGPLPEPIRLRNFRHVELGPEASQGIGSFPAALGQAYPCFVSDVDADGNETGGVRMPDVAVPLATYAGWNPRHPSTGGAGQIVDMQGSTFPFGRTAADRNATGDPRPAIFERYQDREDYLARVRAAAEDLVGRSLLLREDVDLCVSLAAARWDALTF